MGRAGSAFGGFGGLSIVAGGDYLKWGKDSLNIVSTNLVPCIAYEREGRVHVRLPELTITRYR